MNNNWRNSDQPSTPKEPPPDYFGLAVLLLLWGLAPSAFVAIVYSMRVRRYFYQRQFAESLRASRMALLWCRISFVWVLVWLVLIFSIFGGCSSSLN